VVEVDADPGGRHDQADQRTDDKGLFAVGHENEFEQTDEDSQAAYANAHHDVGFQIFFPFLLTSFHSLRHL